MITAADLLLAAAVVLYCLPCQPIAPSPAPQFGPSDKMQQHGFARNVDWQIASTSADPQPDDRDPEVCPAWHAPGACTWLLPSMQRGHVAGLPLGDLPGPPYPAVLACPAGHAGAD